MDEQTMHLGRERTSGSLMSIRRVPGQLGKRRWFVAVLAASSVVGGLTNPTHAQTNSQSISSSQNSSTVVPGPSQEVLSATQSLSPATLPDPVTARVELDQAIQRLHSLLQLGSRRTPPIGTPFSVE